MDNKRIIRNIAIYAGIPIIVFFIIFIMFNRVETADQIKYSDLINYFEEEQVSEYRLDLGNGQMQLVLNDDNKTKIRYQLPNIGLFFDDCADYIKAYNKANPDNKMVQDLERPAETSWLMSLLPTLLIMGGMVVLWVFMFRRMNGGGGGNQMNFGKAKVKQLEDEKRKTTFAEVAGADEEKEELREIVEFLKNPKKYNELGARIPKGVLLVGPPGTGKTLLARAVAGEAGVPFFSISGSDFVEMFVGVGASRVRDLFDKAKKNNPCIIFIDEIDAVGRQRGAGLGGGHDEREQTLNQLLVEMDGFGANEGVIMIAATNRPDILDPALMRPGRFDRQVTVGYPDVKGREEILRVHAKGKPLAPDVVLGTIAKTTGGFTGADLENLLNESALLAARKERKAITMTEIEEASIKVMVGTEKKSRVTTAKERRLTAYHEAGHAITRYYSEGLDPVHMISIIPRGMAGGFTMHLPTDDKSFQSMNEMKLTLITMLAGRVAEELVLGDISTGASNDIERATKISRDMVTRYGMSEVLGPILYGQESSNPFLGKEMGHVSNYSEQTAYTIDGEIRSIMTAAYGKARDILSEHIDILHRMAGVLLDKEKLDAKEFLDVMSGKLLPAPKQEEPVAAIADKAEQEAAEPQAEMDATLTGVQEPTQETQETLAEGESPPVTTEKPE